MEELRAMTIGMAVEWAKSQNDNPNAEAVIAVAKAFQNHIQYGTGLS